MGAVLKNFLEKTAQENGQEHGRDQIQHANFGDAQHIQADGHNEQGAYGVDLRYHICGQVGGEEGGQEGDATLPKKQRHRRPWWRQRSEQTRRPGPTWNREWYGRR